MLFNFLSEITLIFPRVSDIQRLMGKIIDSLPNNTKTKSTIIASNYIKLIQIMSNSKMAHY